MKIFSGKENMRGLDVFATSGTLAGCLSRWKAVRLVISHDVKDRLNYLDITH